MKWEIYRDRSKKRLWRWRIKARNGLKLGDSGQGYKRRRDCEHAIDLIRQNCPAIPVWEGK